MTVSPHAYYRPIRSLISEAVVLALVSSLLSFAVPSPAYAATIVVSPGAGLQAAVTAAKAGDVIVLSAGEYTTSGLISIDKPLTILGAGKDVTFVRSYANTAFPAVHNGDGSAWISVKSTGSLTIEGMTLDARSQAAVKTGSIIYARGAVIANDLHLTNASYQRYYGFGLMLIGPGHRVTNCTFDNIERVGLYHAGGSQDASPALSPAIEHSLYVSGCDFVGSGPGDYVQYGLETERGGRTLAEVCTFYGYSGLDSGYNSSAVLGTSWRLPGPTSFTVNDSQITSCTSGMYVGYTDQTTETVTSFSRNTFSEVPWDVFVEGDAAVMSLPAGEHNIDLDEPGTEDYEYFTWWEKIGTEWAEVVFDPSLIVDFWNRAPVAVEDGYTTPQGQTLLVAAPGVLGNDTDANIIDTAAGPTVSDGPDHGTAYLDEDGSLVYVPDADFIGTDTFTYTVTDGFQVSTPGTVTVEVVNVAPIAVDDSWETSANSTLMIVAPGVLGNDLPGDSDPMTAVLNSPAVNGTVFLAADGSFGYVPDEDFFGTDVFTYRVTDGLLVSSPAVVTITVTEPEEPPLPGGVIRVWGVDRYATNVDASLRGFPDGAETVVIATGANWPDALGGSPLAGAVDGPLLLTGRDALPAGVKAEITRLGATKAYVLGGAAAVSGDVESELAELLGAGNVTRLAGTDRYGTAQVVADEVIEILGDAYDGTAFVATGGNFPDALAASPVAAAMGWPILLANPISGALYVPGDTDATTILGGTSAVSADVETGLKADLGDAAVMRIGGGNRYGTAALVAVHGVDSGLLWNGVGVATGEQFPDALSAGPMLGSLGTVMLLTPGASLHAEAASVLVTNKDAIDTVHIIGGAAAVSEGVKTALESLLGF